MKNRTNKKAGLTRGANGCTESSSQNGQRRIPQRATVAKVGATDAVLTSGERNIWLAVKNAGLAVIFLS